MAELVREAQNRIATGFVGTPLVSDALTLTGHLDKAYDLLLEQGCPSWLYQVAWARPPSGSAGTACCPDGTSTPATMTSFNHYALGAVADWLHRVVGGIAPQRPATARCLPAAARRRHHLGNRRARDPVRRSSIAWQVEADHLVVDVRVPVGATGVLELPGLPPETLAHGTHHRETSAVIAVG